MTSRRTVLGTLAGATLLPTLGVLPAFAADAAQEALKDIAKRKGLRFGTAVGSGRNQFGDPAYRALVERECGIIVAENEMKWQALEPRRDAPNFAPADAMLAWANASGMAMRGHNLFWQAEKWLPAWVAQEDFGNPPAQGAERLMRKHVQTVCGHFGKAIGSWDVVNEAVDPADGKLRQNALTRPLGAIEQIDLAFRLAHEYAPHAQLVYNDYMRGDLGSTRHRAGVLAMLADLKKRGTPVHALGLQSHIGSWDDVSSGGAERAKADLLEWRRFLDEVTGMGYELLITEFDVNDRRLPADIARRDAGVAAAARDYLDLTLSYPGLRDFLLWGMADHINWLQTWDEAPRTDKLPMRPCPYDGQLRAKPLRQAMAEAMRSMPARPA
jgi:endo-1,4-beta-xylanase